MNPRPPQHALVTGPAPTREAQDDAAAVHPAMQETRPVPAVPGPGTPRPTGRAAARTTEDRGVPADEAAAGFVAAGDRIAQYEVIRELGHGGMGVVYLARDLRLGRLVAIKFLTQDRAELDRRFQIEAQATARCRHENIVVIYDVGDHEGRPYMVLEYLEGQTLRGFIEQHTEALAEGRPGAGERSPLATARTLAVMIPVVRALVRAHAAGIVHRDLKPTNIMLTSDGTIKVLDFGIAKLRENARRDETARGHWSTSNIDVGGVMGTVAYMSPEQLEGTRVDHRCDLWAVGIMLFEMVVGRHPAGSFSPGELFALANLDEPVISVRELRPELGPLASIIDRCLVKDREYRIGDAEELLRDLEAVAAEVRTPTHEPGRDPFAGLAAFQREDAHRFFGREREITSVLARLPSQPLLVVAGPSGLGKSSLVRAGVIPALERSGEGWDAHVIRPGRQPLHALLEVIDGYAETTTERTAYATISLPLPAPHGDDDDGDEGGGAERLRLIREPGWAGAALRAQARKRRRRFLLFIDQFEELFTLTTDQDEVRAFIACLEGIADDPDSSLRVILSIRSDFLYRAAEYRSFAQRLSVGLFFVPPLGRDALRDALEKPVRDAGYVFESPAVVEDMLGHVVASPGALPLLQFAASQLWAQRDTGARLLTEASYRAMGGLSGTLASHADRVLAGLTGRETALAQAIFLRLVTPEHTRDVVDIRDLYRLTPTPEAGEVLIQRLVAARLLVIEASGPDERTVELVHESLITSWPRLVGWLDENRDDSAFLARLRSAVVTWQRSGRSEDLLWRGEAAMEAHLWRKRHGRGLNADERAYMDAVIALARRSLRRKRVALVATMVFLGCIALAASWAKRDSDRKSRQLAENVAQLRVQEQRVQESLASETRAKKNAEDERDNAKALARELEQAVLDERAATAAAEAARAQERRANEQARRSLSRARHSRESLEQALEREKQASEEEKKAKEKAEAAEREARAAKERMRAIVERANGGRLGDALDLEPTRTDD